MSLWLWGMHKLSSFCVCVCAFVFVYPFWFILIWSWWGLLPPPDSPALQLHRSPTREPDRQAESEPGSPSPLQAATGEAEGSQHQTPFHRPEWTCLIYIHTPSHRGTPISQCHCGFVRQLCIYVCVCVCVCVWEFVCARGYLCCLIGGHVAAV